MLRFGIAGFGLHAAKRLMPGFAHARHCTVTALSRRSLEAAQQTAAEFGIPYAFGSVRELCRCPEVDAVFITTPNAAHLENVIEAADAGKHILCEKPMAMNADEAGRMIAAAKSAGVRMGVAQIFRFANTVQRMREHVQSRAIGQPVLARAVFRYPGRGHARAWINDLQQGGGVIADVGVHCIDALRFILGEEAVRVSARAIYDMESGEADATGLLNLEFASGVLATVEVSMRAAYFTSLEIVGEAGEVRSEQGLNVDKPVVVELRAEKGLREQMDNRDAFTRQADAFANWVLRRVPFPAPAEEGLRNQMVLDAAYRSVKSGKVEAVG